VDRDAERTSASLLGRLRHVPFDLASCGRPSKPAGPWSSPTMRSRRGRPCSCRRRRSGQGC